MFAVGCLHLPDVLAPGNDRELADLVLFSGLGQSGPICLVQYGHHLMFGEATLSQGLIADDEPFF